MGLTLRNASLANGTVRVRLDPTVTDPDAQAFLTVTGITNPTQRSAIDTLVLSLKANNLWTKMNAIYPFVGGNATTHMYNLKDPRNLDVAFRLSFVGGITHTSTGVTFGGINGYADTFMAASSNLTNNNNSLSYYSRTSAASTDQFAIDMGAVPDQQFAPSLYCLVLRRFNSNTAAFAAATNTTSAGANTTVTDGSGYFIGSITNSSSRKLYRNGSSIATNTTNANQSLPSQKIFIGAISNNNIGSLFSGPRECAFASIGSGLTDADALNLHTAVQALQTTLGRQV